MTRTWPRLNDYKRNFYNLHELEILKTIMKMSLFFSLKEDMNNLLVNDIQVLDI